jgi:hypothetical protein
MTFDGRSIDGLEHKTRLLEMYKALTTALGPKRHSIESDGIKPSP